MGKNISRPEQALALHPSPRGELADALRLDSGKEIDRICQSLRDQVFRQLRRRGAVVGVSGGIDSSVVAALCAKALGANNVQVVFMPERDSDPESLRLGRMVAAKYGIPCIVEDIASPLAALGCYERRDDFIRQLVPEFGSDWRCKVAITNVFEAAGYNLTKLVVQAPDGSRRQLRMPLEVYLGVVAATNMKQRVRKQIEYYHADRCNYAVMGTPNRLEYELGFFVKNGDGAADIKPIAHLYKSQVYQLAEALEVPDEIRARMPTTDTWPLQQSQEEFYFSVPYSTMDVCLLGLNSGADAKAVSSCTGLTIEQVQLVWRDIQAKRKAAEYLHAPPLLVEPVLKS